MLEKKIKKFNLSAVFLKHFMHSLIFLVSSFVVVVVFF